MGGKDHRAVYLVGDENVLSNDSGFLYLDPHYVQSAIPTHQLNFTNSRSRSGLNLREEEQLNISPENLATYHTYDLRTLDPQKIQTSLAPGFYIRDRGSF